LLLMGHAGHLPHADAMDQITLLAKEVLPRVRAGSADLAQPSRAASR
jgi:hypothetical protein